MTRELTRAAVALALALTAAAACGDNEVEPPEPPDIAFPADYAATYVEVRDCRPSGDHDLNNIRVLADPAALGPYQTRDDSFPEGAVVLKEEYDFADVDCQGAPVQWTVMQRLPGPQTGPELGWRWQRVDGDRNLLGEDESRCFGCHVGCGSPPDGFEGTCAVP